MPFKTYFPDKMFHLMFTCGLLPLKLNPQSDVPDYSAISVLPDDIINIQTLQCSNLTDVLDLDVAC